MHFFLHCMLCGLQTMAVCDATENGSCCVVCKWGSGRAGRGRAVLPNCHAFTRYQMTQHWMTVTVVWNSEWQFSEDSAQKYHRGHWKHRNGSVGSMVANHRDVGESSVVVTTLFVAYATLTWATNSCCWCLAVQCRNIVHSLGNRKLRKHKLLLHRKKAVLMRLSSWKQRGKKLETHKQSRLAAADGCAVRPPFTLDSFFRKLLSKVNFRKFYFWKCAHSYWRLL